MKDAGGGVGPFQRDRSRAERRVDSWVVHHESTATCFGDLLGAVIQDVLLGDLRRVARSPVDLDEVGGTYRRRVGRRTHDDPSRYGVRGVLQYEARDVPRDPLSRGVINSADDRTVARRGNLRSGINHSIDDCINAVTRRTVDLCRDVQSIRLLPNEAAL